MHGQIDLTLVAGDAPQGLYPNTGSADVLRKWSPTVKFKAIVHEADEGGYRADVPAIPAARHKAKLWTS
jgi:hypothetical protein